MIKFLQEHIAYIQLQGGNNKLLEKLMNVSLLIVKYFYPNTWVRNSYYFNAHHPLISDIDLSFIGDHTQAKNLWLFCKKVPLIGELNFYPNEIKEDLIALCNPLELKRDPMLVKHNIHQSISKAQREVFLSRHIIGDSYWLNKNPTIRKKKWDYILAISDLSINRLSLQALLDLTLHPDKIRAYLEHSDSNLFDFFNHNSDRFYFPQKHIWNSTDQDYLSTLSSEDKEITIEQIKWEFWGIGTQLHWIDLTISYEYLLRLKNAVINIGIKTKDLEAIDRVLFFIHKLIQAKK